MGCGNLWKYLTSEGVIQYLRGDHIGQYEHILQLIDGKFLAVDMAVWEMEVKSIKALRQVLQSHAAALIKVVFEKIYAMLRMGCTPVIVLEGDVDTSKYQLMAKRYNRPYQAKKSHFRHGDLTKLVQALGLMTIQAPGEGEATCAALECQGLVDGCITKDADALAFGAQTVFKALSLSSRTVRQNKVDLCLLAEARRILGISSGGMRAMQLITLLHGGDYNIGGTQDVGIVQAVTTVQSLLQDKDNDMEVIDDFWDHLLKSEHEITTNAPRKKSCKGCRRCGCETPGKNYRIAKHNKLGCVGCGTQSKALGGNGEGGCILMKEGESCKCTYCMWKSGDENKREIMLKVFEKQRRQSVQHSTLQSAFDAYERQRTKALECARAIPNRNTLQWQRRPDFNKLKVMFERLLKWEAEVFRDKLMPLLIEWDLTHIKDPDIEFRIVKVLGTNRKGKQSGNQYSEVVVQVERIHGITEEYEEFDKKWLTEKNNNGKWSVRNTLVEEHYSSLLTEYEQEKKQKKRRKKDRAEGCQKITAFLEPTSNPLEISPEGTSIVLSSVEKDAAKTPSKVRKAPLSVDKTSSSSSNKKLKSSQETMHSYLLPKEEKIEKSIGEESAFSTRFGSVPRRFTFLSIYSDESDNEIHKQVGNVKMEIDSLDNDVIDLSTPIKTPQDEEGNVVDLLTPENTP